MLKLFFTMSLAITAGSVFAQDDAGKAVWAATEIKADGNIKEWPQPLHYYDSDTKLFFAFANDDKNIYICLQTNDDVTQAKIMRAGMSVTISAKAGGKHKATIDFPLAKQSAEEEAPAAYGAQKKFDRGDMRNNFLLQHTMMEIKGFTGRDGMVSIHDSSGINAGINWDEQNKMSYEMVIPLSAFYGAGYTEEDLLKEIAVAIEINAMSKQGNGGSGGRSYSGGGGHMGGGGRMGGGQRGGNGAGRDETDPSSQNNNARASLYEKNKLKAKFTLSKKIITP
jgi:hypothetical protein